MRYDLSGKTALVTGATSGIGAEIAKGLALMGAQVLVHGRSEAKVTAALEGLSPLKNGLKHLPFIADLSSFHEVSRLAEQVGSSTDKLDILINNAGLWTPHKKFSQDHVEFQFAVNYLAPFLLTHKLQAHLLTAKAARVVNVSSTLHQRGSIDFDDLMFEHRRYNGIDAYAQSKLALVMMTREWAQRLDHDKCSFFAVHPGVVRSNIAGNNGWQSWIFNVFGLFYLTPRQGARTPIYLAAEPGIMGRSGKYFRDYEESPTHVLVEDVAARSRLWSVSEQLCNLT